MDIRIFPILLISCILSLTAVAQYTVEGDFPPLAGQQIRLVGFDGFGIYTIDTDTIAEAGGFKLSYSDKDRGMGYLTAEDNKSYIVVLANEDIQLKGQLLSMPESIQALSGKENKLFEQYAVEHPKREQALSAWVYLQKIYQGDSFFIPQLYAQKAIGAEMQRIKQEDKDFLQNLDPNSYVSWFLPARKLVSSVSTVAQYRTEEIPASIAAFRNMDYTDVRLHKSGLLIDAIESHFWLLENSGRSLDSTFIEMNVSIDYMINSLSKDEAKFNQITKYLFDLLEKRSLMKSSEYLALKVLTQNACTLDDNLAKQMESYRAMKKGNTAPDIRFNGDVFKNASSVNLPSFLSEIDTEYKVVVFGASWCTKCGEELSQIRPLYEKWKSNSVEVVFMSLDTEKSAFEEFTKYFPFISSCDYKQWDSQAAKDYYVFATPTIFLLDKDHKILLRPNSVNQMDAWVDWYLVQGNKQK